ncbi:PRTRC system protein E [Sulfuricystis multivorans]|uniref:PRTRC system protein E n=1 Tax=Sulfuricystis multivorans TaxID=2211108 RepID=UPI000F81ADBD|nr:PRTRC system protein E [Sulfuricystis multivorans]
MFKALQPLLTERSIHILLSPAKDGKVGVYVEPVKLDDKEDNAFITPFRCEGTPEELDAELPGVLAQWLTSRAAVTSSLRDALAAAEAQAKAAADEAKKKAADRNKKLATTTGKANATAKSSVKVPAQVVTPSLLDGCGVDKEDKDETCEGGTLQGEGASQPSVITTPAAAAVTQATSSAQSADAAASTSAVTAPAAASVAAPIPAQQAAEPAPVQATAAVVTVDPVTAELF